MGGDDGSNVVKLNNYFLINVGILGAAANDGMLAFWGHGRGPHGGGRGFSFLINY
jgi:hypothetical protein